MGAGSVTGMFTVRELLQRGGNVRACMRECVHAPGRASGSPLTPSPSPEKWRGDIEQLVEYFPRGKRGLLTFCQADVTKPETLGEGARPRPAFPAVPASRALLPASF